MLIFTNTKYLKWEWCCATVAYNVGLPRRNEYCDWSVKDTRRHECKCVLPLLKEYKWAMTQRTETNTRDIAHFKCYWGFWKRWPWKMWKWFGNLIIYILRLLETITHTSKNQQDIACTISWRVFFQEWTVTFLI